MRRSSRHLAEHLAETPVLVLVLAPRIDLTLHDAEGPLDIGTLYASVYPAVQNALLACRAEGLGCVLTTLLCEVEEELRGLLGFPGPWGVAAAVPLGYPLLGGHGSISRRPVSKMFFADSWGKAW